MRFSSGTIAVALAACMSSSSQDQAQDASDVREEVAPPVPSIPNRVVGLLTLPQVFGEYPCETDLTSEIELYAEPASPHRLGVIQVSQPWTVHPNGGCEGLRIVVNIEVSDSVTDLPTFEYEYEMPAAVVLAWQDEWFNIRLAEGSAWVRRSGNSRYIPLEALLVGSLTYISKPDGRGLSSVPGGANRSIGSDFLTMHRSVQVLDTRTVNGDLWLHLVIHSQSPCESSGEPEPVAEGWLPAHTAAGEPTVWFHSRGC
jgi:hypothetical protein